MASLKELRETRIQKLQKLKSIGINPYPAQSKKEFSNKGIVDNFDQFESKTVTVTGRLMSWREHGNIIFGHIQDESGNLQVFVQKAKLSETNPEKGTLGFKDLSLLDIGDFVEVTGEVGKTTRGEVSVVPQTIKILTKSIRPLPEKWEGLTDAELIFRKRYLDLVMTPARRELFKRKAKFWAASRAFMHKHDFLEVETPILEHVTGGADAKPFVTHHNALDEDFYLRISSELYQKRLIAGGFEKIYTLGPNFRNEGIDDEHLQEYYQLEWYWAYADYRDNMKLVRDLLRFIAKEVYGKTKFENKGMTFDLADDWEELDYEKVIKEKLEVDIFKDSEADMLAVLKKNGIVLEGAINKPRIVDNLWKIIRKNVAGPAFLINIPKFISPLAKSISGDEEKTERFQVIFAGSEMGNGYSELNDPVDQYERFLDQQKARDAGDDEAQMMDIDYVEALEYGMPPTSGYGQSERVFWSLENIAAREGTLFPQMKAKVDESVKEIYPEFAKLISKKPKATKKIKSAKADISDEIKEKFPGISFAYTVIEGVSITKQDKELNKLKDEALNAQKTLTLDEIKEIPSIKTYRKMLKETGVDINSKRPSPEALLRRIVQGKGLYAINTAVDAYNVAVVETKIGLGGFNADKINFPVSLRLSQEGESVLLLGDDQKTALAEGEIVYADNEKLLTVDLNYRDNNETKITLDTKNIILFADGGEGIDPQDVLNALQKGAEYIQQFCGGKVKKPILVQ